MNGKFTVKQDLTDEMDVKFLAFNFQGGQYKLMVEKLFKHFCKSLYKIEYKNFYEDYQSQTSNPVAYNTCPYPAGSSEVKNYHFNDNRLILPPRIPGREKWRVGCRILKGQEELGGYNIYLTVISNSSLLG